MWRELDQAITTLNLAALPPDELLSLDPDVLQQLAYIQQLHCDLNIPVLTVLSWYAPLDTARDDIWASPPPRSLYEALFQNPAVIKLNPGEADPFELDESREELKEIESLTIMAGSTSEERTRNILAGLLGVLQVNESDLSRLIEGDERHDTPAVEVHPCDEHHEPDRNPRSFSQAIEVEEPQQNSEEQE